MKILRFTEYDSFRDSGSQSSQLLIDKNWKSGKKLASFKHTVSGERMHNVVQAIHNVYDDDLDSVTFYILSVSSNCLIEFDGIDFRISYANAAFRKLVKEPKKKISGLKIIDIVFHSSVPSVEAQALTDCVTNCSPRSGIFRNHESGNRYNTRWEIMPVTRRRRHNKLLMLTYIDIRCLRQRINELNKQNGSIKKLLNQRMGFKTGVSSSKEQKNKLISCVNSKGKPSNKKNVLRHEFPGHEGHFDDWSDCSFMEVTRENKEQFNIQLHNSTSPTATEFLRSNDISGEDIDELGDSIRDFLFACETLNSSRNVNGMNSVHWLVKELQTISRHIYLMPEFLELGSALKVFTDQMLNHAGVRSPEFRAFLTGIGEDLTNWFQRIFIDMDATDVHWLDTCITVNLNQMSELLKLMQGHSSVAPSTRLI